MEALGLITIPLFSGAIGYVTNGSGVWMLFQPLRFKGVRVPGLGLIWFSREPLEDPLSYQVLEAQPDMLEPKRAAGRGGRTVHRQILLAPFGEDFCRVCLP